MEDSVLYRRLVTGGFSPIEAEVICAAICIAFEDGEDSFHNRTKDTTAAKLYKELTTKQENYK